MEEEYKNKTSQLKGEIQFLEKQSLQIINKFPKNQKGSLSPIKHFEAWFELKKILLRQVYFHLLLIRYSVLYTKTASKRHIQEAENLIIRIISLWESEMGRRFLEMYHDDFPIHQLKSNLEIREHFSLFGYAIDRLDFYSRMMHGGSTRNVTLLRIRCRFLMIFCNALNFKKLIKDIETLAETYASSQETLDLLYLEMDQCLDGLWKHYFVESSENPNFSEMQVSLDMLEFARKLASFLMHKDRMSQYRKKYEVWKKFMDKASERTLTNA